jgi:4-amino-4-deoxy-L-arabinose transferase-like glycosyltransferase
MDARLVWALLACVAVIFLVLRLRNVNQVLGWDEAQLALTARSFAYGTGDVWSSMAYIHPPLYLWLLVLVGRAVGANVAVYKVISVLFSLGTLLVTFALAKELFDERVALLSALFLALLQGATVMDTWVKQDPMAGLAIVLAVYLFVKERWVWAGIVFGLGMLTKETAIFALMVIFLYSLACWEREKVKRAALVGLIGFGLSFWWYLFLSKSVGHFWDFFTRGVSEGSLFRKPFWFYFQGLPGDLGWALLILLAAGLALSVYKRVSGPSKAHMLPVVWFAGIYLFLSVSAGKPYWMVPPAFPAIAMLCGVALGSALDLVPKVVRGPAAEKAARLSIVVLAAALVFFQVAATGYLKYNRARYPAYWEYATGVRRDALYLKSKALGKPVIVVLDEKQINRDPVLTYYLGDSKDVSLVSQVLEQPRLLVDKYVIPNEADWIYIRSRADVARVDAFLAGLAGVAPYRIARNSRWGTAIEMTW